MYSIATCTASILRGTTTDEYGDVTDASTVVHTGVLASISEDTSSVWDPSTQTPRVVRTCVALVPSDTDVLVSDRLRDDLHGVTYAIENVTQSGGPGFTRDLRLELRRVT